MSLINKMLQDLDARGSQSGETQQLSVKSVTRAERRVPLALLAGAAALTLVVIAGAVFGWRYLKMKRVPPAPVPQAVTVIVPPTVLVPAAAAVVVPAAAPAPAPNPIPARETAAQAVAAPAPEIVQTEAAVPAPAVVRKKEDRKIQRTVERFAVPRNAANCDIEPCAVRAKPAAAEPAAARVHPPVRAAAEPESAQGRQMTPQQRAESQYRSALASLQDGRINEATIALEQSLQLDPHHDAARQTLVGLLIEARRIPEAIRQLQFGLTLDPRQPTLAILLARLQIEGGGNGIDTLTRTLPYAAGNGDYHAFLAGALQRAQRHREAAVQYQAALRTAPQNGVWLMGMGISLLAEQRNAEALDAFQKAKASGTLTPELLAFVERKLQQLAR